MYKKVTKGYSLEDGEERIGSLIEWFGDWSGINIANDLIPQVHI